MQRAAADHRSHLKCLRVAYFTEAIEAFIEDFLGFYFSPFYFGLSTLFHSFLSPFILIYYAEGKERKGAQTQHPSVTALALDKLPPAIWEMLCCPGTYTQGCRPVKSAWPTQTSNFTGSDCTRPSSLVTAILLHEQHSQVLQNITAF